jgi:hypothetical protein
MLGSRRRPARWAWCPNGGALAFDDPSRHLRALGFVCVAVSVGAGAQTDDDLAGQVVNPFTSMVKVPLQINYDQKIGPERSGKSYTLAVQPLIPFTLDADWDLISRTIFLATAQKDVSPGAGNQSGLGDTLQSFFISPRKASAGGVDWGLGAAVLLPTASDDLGAKKWALGPTGGLFRDSGPWTTGILANHIWSVGGSGGDSGISSTFLQPIVSYTAGEAWSYTLQTEATYDWKVKQWSVPIEASLAKLTRLGGQHVNLEAGVHYWAASAESGPKGWGFSFTTTLLFTKPAK